jgi:hypothetical protein
MFYPHVGSTRAALLIESTDSNGEKHVLVYHLTTPITLSVDTEYTTMFNVFDGASFRPLPTLLSMEAYLAGPPREWDQQMPSPQEEIEPTHLAIESNESEIIIDEDGFEEWQQED